MTDTTALRRRLHEALDSALDAFVASEQQHTQHAANGDLILEKSDAGSFSHTWPPKDGHADVEQFHRSALYVLAADRSRFIRLGWTSNREAWGRKRERSIAFLESRAGSRYPLIEFVETDDGHFAAIIPDPKRPRSALTDTRALPGRFTRADVKRTDQLFSAVRRGPTLRLVLPGDDELGMASHGLWVGRLRGRVPL